MGYKKAEDILPADLIEKLQEYAEGETVYIPKKKEKAGWGTLSGAKDRLKNRNRSIYSEYISGVKVSELTEKYFLTDKSIQRIIREVKKDDESV